MLWYNNPEAVQAIQDQLTEERQTTRKGLRLVDGHRHL